MTFPGREVPLHRCDHMILDQTTAISSQTSRGSPFRSESMRHPFHGPWRLPGCSWLGLGCPLCPAPGWPSPSISRTCSQLLLGSVPPSQWDPPPPLCLSDPLSFLPLYCLSGLITSRQIISSTDCIAGWLSLAHVDVSLTGGHFCPVCVLLYLQQSERHLTQLGLCVYFFR